MNGKGICKILKDIRRKIAEENDIEFATSDCKYQGECSGTCPKCEAEVRYLEDQLRKRKMMGKTVAIAGVAAAVMLGTTGCVPPLGTTGGAPLPGPTYTQEQQPLQGDPTLAPEVDGEIYIPEDTEVPELMGEVIDPDVSTGEEFEGEILPPEE